MNEDSMDEEGEVKRVRRAVCALYPCPCRGISLFGDSSITTDGSGSLLLMAPWPAPPLSCSCPFTLTLTLDPALTRTGAQDVQHLCAG